MKKVIIIIIIVVSLLFICGVIGGIYFVLNYPKVEKVEIKEEGVEMYPTNEYIVKVKVSPKKAKKVNIVTTNTDKKVVKVEGKKLTALSNGEAKVCYQQKGNKKAKDCIKVKVTTPREKLKERLDKLCVKKSEGIYSCGTGYTFNVNNNTYTVESNADNAYQKYVYYYTAGYIDGYTEVSGYNVKYNYNTTTKTLGCVGSVPAFHNAVCNYSGQETAKNLFETIIQAVDQLRGDITLEDLKGY